MEQLFSFLLTVIICSLAVIYNLPMVFLIGFVSGIAYYVVRSKYANWKLPKYIKETH